MGKELTLEQFRESQEAKTPLGALFLGLLEEDTWSSEIGVQVHFSDSRRYRISFHSDFFPRFHGQNDGTIGFRDKIPTIPEIKKLAMDALSNELAGAASMITTLRHREEKVSIFNWSMTRGLALEALRTKVPGIAVDAPAQKMENLLVFQSDKRTRTFFVKQEEILEDPVPVYEVTDLSFRAFSEVVVMGTSGKRNEVIAAAKQL